MHGVLPPVCLRRRADRRSSWPNPARGLANRLTEGVEAVEELLVWARNLEEFTLGSEDDQSLVMQDEPVLVHIPNVAGLTEDSGLGIEPSTPRPMLNSGSARSGPLCGPVYLDVCLDEFSPSSHIVSVPFTDSRMWAGKLHNSDIRLGCGDFDSQ